jgi:hypothetical protein
MYNIQTGGGVNLKFHSKLPQRFSDEHLFWVEDDTTQAYFLKVSLSHKQMAISRKVFSHH